MAIDAQSGRNALASLAAVSREPEWFSNNRQVALDAAFSLPLPQWDRTDAAEFSLQQQLPAHTAHNTLAGLAADGAATATNGVIYTDLFGALQSHPELVRQYFGSVVPVNENRFIATHYAFVNAGTFVYIPAEVEVELPLRAVQSPAGTNQSTHTHTLIVAERGARVSLVDTHEGAQAGQALHTHIVEVATKAGAAVHFTGMQNLSLSDNYYAFRRCVLEQDASMEWVLGSFGARLSKDTAETLLQGNGSQANSLVLFFGQEKQHLDTEVTMLHTGLHTSSDILARGAAGSVARGIYRALTHIARGARFTSAYQRANTLLLTPDARADAIPALTIDEDEVQAGHAATVGQVDEEQLFYLMSRGLPPNEAIRVIVSGFFDPILQRVPLEDTKAALQQLIDRKATR